MQSSCKFTAPWGQSLKVMTVLVSALLLGVALFGMFNSRATDMMWVINVVIMPPLVLAICALFTVRGFEVADGRLLVQRLFWKTPVSLDNLQNVEVNPEAMKRSIRTFGNGGLFSFTGRFRNKQLGPFRAFAMDPSLSVVLTFPDRVIVVTPDNPARFADQLNRML